MAWKRGALPSADPQAHAGLQQPRRVGMPQRMGRDARLDAGLGKDLLEGPPERVARDRSITFSIGAEPAPVAMRFPQPAQLGENRLGQRHRALLVALAHDADQSVPAVDRGHLEGRRLADAQAAGIHQQECDPGDRLPHATDDGASFGIGENAGQTLALRCLDLFLRTVPSRSRACVCRETGCQHDRAGTSLARRPARRADAKSSCAPPSRRDRRASGDSGRQGRERRGCRRPGYLARGRPRPCRRSYAYAGVSSRWSFWQVDRHMPAPRDYPTRPSHDLTASAIYGEAVQSNYDNVPGHIIVEQYPRQSAPAREGLDVAAQEVLEALAQEKAQKYLPGEAQHHNEGHQRTAGAPDREVAKMSPIDLGLLTGQGA